MSDAIRDAIESNATGPRRAEGDSGSVEQHSLRDQIEADKHIAGQAGGSKAHRGLRFTKLVSPGTA